LNDLRFGRTNLVAHPGMATIATPLIEAPRSPVWILIAFLAGNAVLALAMHVAPSIATVHALFCLVAGVGIAATGRATTIAAMVGYIAGSEVLWRMNHAAVFWEFGKYAVVAVLGIALFRLSVRRNRVFALTYLALLLPSALLTLTSIGLDRARQLISFNLSGPLSLAMCVLYFSNVRFDEKDIRRVMVAAMGPIFGVAIISVVATTTTSIEELEFGGSSSNYITSGGFGPNQVSATLGLGLLFALLMLLDSRLGKRWRAGLLGLACIFAVQAALTFSRAGLFLAFVSAIGAALYLLRDARTRVTLAVAATALFAVANWIVVPQLDDFTGGKLSERYTSTNTSGRSKLADADVEIFADNPILGVGPGMAAAIREEMGHVGAAHTEYTRMLSEHGILGVGAIALLLLLAYRTLRTARGMQARAYTAAMLLWFLLFIAVDAMRIVAPSFAFGLACTLAYSSLPRPPPKLVGR